MSEEFRDDIDEILRQFNSGSFDPAPEEKPPVPEQAPAPEKKDMSFEAILERSRRDDEERDRVRRDRGGARGAGSGGAYNPADDADMKFYTGPASPAGGKQNRQKPQLGFERTASFNVYTAPARTAGRDELAALEEERRMARYYRIFGLVFAFVSLLTAAWMLMNVRPEVNVRQGKSEEVSVFDGVENYLVIMDGNITAEIESAAAVYVPPEEPPENEPAGEDSGTGEEAGA